MAVLWNPGKGFFRCTLFKEEITKLSWFRSLLWTLWDGSEPPKTAPSCDPSYPRAQQTLESGIHETPLQEGSCAHHGIHAPGAAQISLGAGVWNVPPGMYLPPVPGGQAGLSLFIPAGGFARFRNLTAKIQH